MDPQVPTSFIPKKPLMGDSPRGGAGGFLVLIAIILFVLSLAAAGGAFGYGQYLGGAITSKQESLKKAEGAFDTRSIVELQRLDSRLHKAQDLLQNHVAPSGLFTFLSATTLERVQFTGLTLEMDGSGAAHLSMSGIADSFSTLALQSDQFSQAQALRNVIFSGITTDSAGRVVFSVSANVDPGLLSYARQQAGTTQ